MAFQISPGVNFTEKDITLIVPAVATSPAAIVCPFVWGPAEKPIIVSNEAELLEMFGAPKNDGYYAKFWFTASNFLAYGNNLKVVRAVNASDLNAASPAFSGATVTGKQIKNVDHYRSMSFTSSTTDAVFYAAYPGELGNSLSVVVIDNGGYAPSDGTPDVIDYADYVKVVGQIPGTSQFSIDKGNATSKDEIHILIIDKGGLWSGTKGTLLEKFEFLSKASNGLKEDGTSSYYRTVINNKSEYVWVGYKAGSNWDTPITDTSAAFANIDSSNFFKLYSLTGGASHTSNGITDAAISAAYTTHYSNSEEIDIGMLIAGPLNASSANSIIQLAQTRRDCMAFVSPKISYEKTTAEKLTEVLSYRSSLTSSSYGVMDTGYKTQYDKYNDVYRSVPLCADIAGCCARTDNLQDPWWSPAGFARGTILNTIKLDYNPNKTHRDELYKQGINPVVSFDGTGTVLYGDKTLLQKPSAFDRINVRRLFIVLEKAIAKASQFVLFEFNDEFTRSQFSLLVEPYLKNVLGRRGISDYRVVCDSTNNTSQVIDSNNFVADIYIKPNRSINFVQLNFIATPSGISFDEVVGN